MGKPFEAIQFADDIKYLTPEQAIAYLGRNIPVDYADIPSYYRKYWRGILFPFITFSHKNLINMGKLAKTMPFKRPFNRVIERLTVATSPKSVATASQSKPARSLRHLATRTIAIDVTKKFKITAKIRT